VGSASDSDWTESVQGEREPRTSFESSLRGYVESEAEEEDNVPPIERVTHPFVPQKKRPLPRGSLSRQKPDVGRPVVVVDVEPGEVTEETALLVGMRARPVQKLGYGWRVEKAWARVEETVRTSWHGLTHPSEWDVREMTQLAIGAVSAVVLGLLLNVLDALSYGEWWSGMQWGSWADEPRHDIVSVGRRYFPEYGTGWHLNVLCQLHCISVDVFAWWVCICGRCWL
jgi:hypothetical protein